MRGKCPSPAMDSSGPRLLPPNVGERDAALRQMLAGASFLVAAAKWRKHPVMALAATVAAVDLAATAAARWCWMLELAGLDTRALDAGSTRQLRLAHGPLAPRRR